MTDNKLALNRVANGESKIVTVDGVQYSNEQLQRIEQARALEGIGENEIKRIIKEHKLMKIRKERTINTLLANRGNKKRARILNKVIKIANNGGKR
ncbi:MAG: hypothetical protein V1911_00130 [Candidatus Micrarchaeota archaeon]